MALQNFQYDIIMREYSRRQSQVQHVAGGASQRSICRRFPRLLEIDQTVASLSAEKIRTMLSGKPGCVGRTERRGCRSRCTNVPRFFWKTVSLPDYLEPHYFCPSLPGYRIYRRAQMLPVSKKQRSNCFIHSQILQKFFKKKILTTFLLTGILIQ